VYGALSSKSQDTAAEAAVALESSSVQEASDAAALQKV
jgi:hypothetical protein